MNKTRCFIALFRLYKSKFRHLGKSQCKRFQLAEQTHYPVWFTFTPNEPFQIAQFLLLVSELLLLLFSCPPCTPNRLCSFEIDQRHMYAQSPADYTLFHVTQCARCA